MQESRRKALIAGIKGAGYLSLLGFSWGLLVKPSSANVLLLRPPAALDEKQFLSTCIRCGQCVNACPFDTLKLADYSSNVPTGTPYFVPRDVPCYLCRDVPCVLACPTDALSKSSLIVTDKTIDDTSSKAASGLQGGTSFGNREEFTEEEMPTQAIGANIPKYNPTNTSPLKLSKKQNKKTIGSIDVNLSKMGVAIVDTKHCIAYWGLQCDVCYRACPLIDEAIFLRRIHNTRTGRHAFVLPEVDNDFCTGCGKCEKACITKEASIRVVPLSFLGSNYENYKKGWEVQEVQNKSLKLKNEKVQGKTLNYLNEEIE